MSVAKTGRFGRTLAALIFTVGMFTLVAFAAVAMGFMPRYFFHAHLAALDVPATVTIFAVIYLFWNRIFVFMLREAKAAGSRGAGDDAR